MEKLIFTNSRGESIELTNSAPFLLEKVEGLGSPQAKLITSKAVGQDGESYHDTKMEPRDIRAEVAILAKENYNLFELRRSLNRMFNPKLGEGILEYENDYGKWNIKATSVQAPVEGEKFSSSQKMMINLRCSNPYWREIYTKSEEIAVWMGGIKFPLELPTIFAYKSETRKNIINKGDIKAPVEIEIIGPATNPKISNRNTEEFIKVNKTLDVTDRLYITTNFGKKRAFIKDNEGNEANVLNWIDLSSSMSFGLDVGDNVVELSTDDEFMKARIFIKYRNLYIGI